MLVRWENVNRNDSSLDLDELVEDISREFCDQPRWLIRDLAREAAERFRGASVTSFVPIFVRRTITDHLRADKTATRSLPDSKKS